MELSREKSHSNIRTQILSDIQNDILVNRKIGEKLPSESEYAKHYQVARSTIQKVLKDLTSMQLIERVQGKGTFVKSNKPVINIINYKGFSDYAYEMGSEPITKEIKKEVINDGKELYLQRLRGISISEKKYWLTLDETIISLEKYPGLESYDFEKNSLYEVLRKKYQSNPTTAQLTSSAVLSTSEEANLLDVDKNIPLLKIKGEILDEKGGLLEKVTVIYGPNANFELIVGI